MRILSKYVYEDFWSDLYRRCPRVFCRSYTLFSCHVKKYWNSGFTKKSLRCFFFCDILFYIPACCFLCKPNSKIRTLYYLGIIINTRLTKLHQKYHILKREKTVSLPMSNKELFKIFCLTWSYHHLLLRLFLLTREMAGCANNLNFVPSLHCTTKGNCCAG